MALLSEEKYKVENLYLIIFKTKDKAILEVKKEQKFKGDFFDVVMTSKIENIKHHLYKLDITQIVPVEELLEFYDLFEDFEKDSLAVKEKEIVMFNQQEDKLTLNNKEKVLHKEDVKVFVEFIDMILNKEIEPLYLPNSDEEKELSF